MNDVLQVFAATADNNLAVMLKDAISRLVPVRCDFHHCSDAEASLRLASFFGPQVMFVDDRLPGQRALITLTRAENPGTVIVLMTESGGQRSLVTALACGARDYLARNAVDSDSIDRCLWGALAAWAEKRTKHRPSTQVIAHQKVAWSA